MLPGQEGAAAVATDPRGTKMVYPVLCFFPGFFILAVSWGNYPHPVIQACVAVVCIVAWIAQSWRLMGVALGLGLFAGLVLGVPNGLAFVPLTLAGWALLSVTMAARCPRCRHSIAPTRLFRERLLDNRWCSMCGRSRERVWPGQYLARPEAWDGEYHDEGGGTPRPDALIDWWRYVLYKRYLRRQKPVTAGA